MKSYSDFWNWFLEQEQAFFKIINNHVDIETHFFSKIAPKLDGLKEGIYYLAGMHDDNTAELILTPDGVIENIVFIEELVAAAPSLSNWKFTALKPPMEFSEGIQMSGYSFDRDVLAFSYTDHEDYPDEIDITVYHKKYTPENRETIERGVYLYLDNFLGELTFATMIDSLKITSFEEAPSDLIPIEKLHSFLTWRQKEFVEKYDSTRKDTNNDSYSSYKGTTQDGKVCLAVINADLLKWNAKASHPWILKITIPYEGDANNGMPSDAMYEFLDKLENEIMDDLKDEAGYLNIGRETGLSERVIHFACKEFRTPSKVLHRLTQKHTSEAAIDYYIYKDKYWQSFNRFVEY